MQIRNRIRSLVYFSSFHLPGNPTWVVYTWLGSAVAADIIITASIIYYLRESKKRSTEETDDLLQKIVFIVLENNLLTGVMAIIHAVLFATLSTTYHVIANCEFLIIFSRIPVEIDSAVRSRHPGEALLLVAASQPEQSSWTPQETRPRSIDATDGNRYPKLIQWIVAFKRRETTSWNGQRRHSQIYRH